MDEQMAKELVTVGENGVWQMDAKAFHPKPEGFLKVGDVSYPIFSFLDIPIIDSVRVADLGVRDEGTDYREIIDRGIEQIMLLNMPGDPRLTKDCFDGLAPRQIIMLSVMASKIARVPLKAAGMESSSDQPNSPSPSPAAAVSTGGENQGTTSA